MYLALSLVLLGAPLDVPKPELPDPKATPSVIKHPKVIAWPKGKMPTAPAGFTVSLYADDLATPRWLYVLPNGDVLVVQSGKPGKEKTNPAHKITRLRGLDKDFKAEQKENFAKDLNAPHGVALIGETLFIANTDGVLAFPFKAGQTKLEGAGRLILDLPAGGYNNHWTRNLLPNKDGTKLFVSVGSASNVAEKGTNVEILRACILECNLDGTGLRVFASGLRNPVGMDFEPKTGALWTAVNERDELGDDLVPDYITSVKDGAFYGWPYSYFGQHEDPRRKGERPDLVAKSLTPEVAVGSHTASLGLAFYKAETFPEKYHGGAFVGQRGSWNRSKFAGYRVAFVPFKDGKPTGPAEDFLTGFIASESEVYGRPVGVAVASDGALLVVDESGNRVWRVAPEKK